MTFLSFIGVITGLLFAGSSVHAASILILTGDGSSNLRVPLILAGFTVIEGTLAPGQIASRLNSDVVGVYIWNDPSLGNTGVPADPALAFNAADQAALTAFNAAHPNFIMDGLSWRQNLVPDESSFSQNEARVLAAAGGGIVLGADDASGELIVQHVNQVASWFNFDPFSGVYFTPAGNFQGGGSLFSSPNSVNPKGLYTGTKTYSEIPHGLQPNGVFLSTALFGSPSSPLPGFGSPPLPSDVFGGVTFSEVNHLITTNIPGAGINAPPAPIPEPSTVLMCVTGLGAFVIKRRTRRGRASERSRYRRPSRDTFPERVRAA